jgi:hypothetical protein
MRNQPETFGGKNTHTRGAGLCNPKNPLSGSTPILPLGQPKNRLNPLFRFRLNLLSAFAFILPFLPFFRPIFFRFSTLLQQKKAVFAAFFMHTTRTLSIAIFFPIADTAKPLLQKADFAYSNR